MDKKPKLDIDHYSSMLEKNNNSKDLPDNKLTLAESVKRFGPSLRNVINPDEILEYNSDLDIYYRDYKEYLIKKEEYENIILRTIKISIWLVNMGTAPAEDIDILMHFPDGFTLLIEEDFPTPPESPLPPSPPMTQIDKLLSHTNLWGDSFLSPQINLPHFIDHLEPPPNVTVPRIKRTNSYDVNIHVQRVKHLLKVKFDELVIMFNSYEDAQSFRLNYEILAANLPHKTEGALHIIIKKDSV